MRSYDYGANYTRMKIFARMKPGIIPVDARVKEGCEPEFASSTGVGALFLPGVDLLSELDDPNIDRLSGGSSKAT